MSVGHDGTPYYDAGQSSGHLERNGLWLRDPSWDGGSEVSGSRRAVTLSSLGTDEPVITSVLMSSGNLRGNRIFAALFHRHLLGDVVYSVVTEDLTNTLAGTRAVEVISRLAYRAIHSFVTDLEPNQSISNAYQLNPIAWSDPPPVPLIDTSLRRDFWSQQTTRRSRARSMRFRK
jgi:hypothetical protein